MNIVKVFTLFFIIALSQTAWAGNEHNRNLSPLGEREAFMGNTGAGMLGSPGAVYFNPAGLHIPPRKNVTSSSLAIIYSETHSDEFSSIGSENVPFAAYNFGDIPFSVINGFETKNLSIAFSILKPTYFDLNSRVNFDVSGANVFLSQILEQSETWFGVTMASSFNRHWRWGLGFHVVYSVIELMQTWDLTADAAPNVLGTFTNFTEVETYLGIVTGGILFRPKRNLNFGFKFHAPSIQLGGERKVDIIANSHTGVLTRVQTSESHIDPIHKIPIELVLGMYWRPSRNFSLVTDISWIKSLEYQTSEGTNLPGGDQSAKSDSALRYNLGMDFSFNHRNSLLLGYQFNPSTNNDMSKAGNEAKDFHSITAGWYLKGKAVKTGIGIYYTWAKGDRVINDSLDIRPIEEFRLGALLTTSIYY